MPRARHVFLGPIPAGLAVMTLTAVVLLQTTPARAGDASAAASQAGGWNVREYGAAGDGKAKDTAAIQQAVDAASEQGGGMVRLPAGRYLSGTIRLKDGVTLHLDKGATLLGSTDMSDYPEFQSPVPQKELEFGRYALVHAEGVHDVGVEGEGVIDGQGKHDAFNIGKKRAAGMGKFESVLNRPFILAFTRCTGVRVRGLTLRDSAYWVEDYLDCDNVLIEGLTVRSAVNGNNDGIDIDGSRNVRVANCDIKTGDDALCLKASYTDCQRVVVENCILSSGCNGFKCGTSSIGGYKDITASNCVVYDTTDGGISLEMMDGGTMDGVVVKGFVLRNVGAPIFIRLGDRKRKWVEVKEPLPTGQVRNIIISDVVASGCGRPRKGTHPAATVPVPASVTGLPGHPLQGVTLSNIRINFLGGGTQQQADLKPGSIPEAPGGYPEYDMFGDLPAYGLFCRHVEGLTLHGVTFGCDLPDARPALVCDDVPGLQLDGVRDRGEPVSGTPAK